MCLALRQTTLAGTLPTTLWYWCRTNMSSSVSPVTLVNIKVLLLWSEERLKMSPSIVEGEARTRNQVRIPKKRKQHRSHRVVLPRFAGCCFAFWKTGFLPFIICPCVSWNVGTVRTVLPYASQSVNNDADESSLRSKDSSQASQSPTD